MKTIMIALAALVGSAAIGSQSIAQPAIIAPGNTGETVLRLYATGAAHSRADQVSILVPITTRATTALAARASVAANVERLTSALVAHGISESAISQRKTPTLGFIGNALPDDGPQTALAAVAQRTASTIVEIELSDIRQVSSVEAVLDAQNQAMQGSPFYSLRDDRAAKAAATADAIAKGRKEAETYAAALGLRVDRVVEVSNYGKQPIVPANADAYMRMAMDALTEESGPNVTTEVRVWMKFLLVPR